MFPVTSPVVVLIGPTAIGKTALSIDLAHRFDFEIVSIDSMQVYRYMDIGTAKISEGEMQGIPHHMIDIANPDADFNTGKFERLALKAIADIFSRKKRVLLTGGTGMYLRSILSGLSRELPCFPEIRAELQQQLLDSGNNAMHKMLDSCDYISAKRLHPNDTQRVLRALEIFKGTGKPWSRHIEDHQSLTKSRFTNVLKIGLTCERSQLYTQIEKRTHIMLSNGLEEEVETLLAAGYGADLKSMQSIGYRHMLNYISGEWSREQMTEKLVRDTRRYAKRQYTWFNKEPGLQWLDKNEQQASFTSIESFLNDVGDQI